MFDAPSVGLAESETTAAGSEAVVVDMGFAKVGLTICYDLRFPELFAHLTGSLGADIVLVPSAFTVTTGAAHWQVLLRARAIENQCVIVAPAQCGKFQAPIFTLHLFFSQVFIAIEDLHTAKL